MLTITPHVILKWLLEDIWKISAAFIFFAFVSIFYALSIPNSYSSNAKVSSNLNEQSTMGGALSNLGGLASMAGFSIGGGTSSPEVLKEQLLSGEFIASFIRKYKLEPHIMAVKSYEISSDSFIYDEEVYDLNKNIWTREVKLPLTMEPSDSELVDKFIQKYTIGYERKAKLITLNYESYSPNFSQQVLVDLVKHFNEFMRKKALSESQLSVKYLKEQLASASYSEVKVALQQILEEQFKKLAVSETREEYALRFIHYPMVAVKKSGPKRAVICVAISFIGTFLSVTLLLSVRIIRMSKRNVQ